MPSLGPIVLDPRTLKPACFPDSETFPHFDNPDEPRCFACNSHLMLVRPIEVTAHFVLMAATTRLDDGSFVVIPDCWLVFPRSHVTSFHDMPHDWTVSVKQALRVLGIEQPFCTGENWGSQAGQTIPHGHTWIIGRGGDEAGLITEDTGLATLILLAKTHGIYKH